MIVLIISVFIIIGIGVTIYLVIKHNSKSIKTSIPDPSIPDPSIPDPSIPPPTPEEIKECTWGEWNDCSVTECGQKGVQQRKKIGTNCSEPVTETKICETEKCQPIDCKVSEWGDWGECDAICGDSKQSRFRTILIQPKYEGKECPTLTETRDCNLEPCECTLSEWSEWGDCSKNCGGGVKKQTRTIITPGRSCGTLERSEQCNTDPCPVDCVVSGWSDWSECTKTCGGGKQVRSRSIIVHPVGTGKICPPLSEERECNTNVCRQDCEVGEWTEWSECSKSCGSGTRSRTRKVLKQPAGGGYQCPQLTQIDQCNTQPCNIDCMVSEWGPWSNCSEGCGGGIRTRSRRVLQMAQGDGNLCPPLVETGECNTQPCATDCKVSEWSDWSDCYQIEEIDGKEVKKNVSCGGGVQSRTRTIISPASEGGMPCPTTQQIRPCNTTPCPSDCKMSDWSNWSACTQSCGGGTQIRTREILQFPNTSGKPCGTLLESRECNTQACTPDDCIVGEWSDWSVCGGCGNETQIRNRQLVKSGEEGKSCPPLTQTKPCSNPGCPKNCEVTPWSNWSGCDKECGGGTQMRTRFITQDPENGGTECPPLIENKSCREQPCPIDCEVSDWGTWGECDRECGSGRQQRKRSILTQPANGGRECPSLVEEKECNTQPCPIDCVVSDYGNLSECTKTCGGGTQTQSRTIITQPQHGGKECPPLTQTLECNTQPCPIDCEVGPWGVWGECSSACGGGRQYRTRPVITDSAYGGQICPPLSESRDCNTQPCPRDCEVSDWSNWGECDKVCGTGKQTRSRVITVQPVGTGKECPPLLETQDCNTQPCPVNCQVSEWSDWSACTETCGGGTTQRTRTINVPARYGGTECPPLLETKICNTHSCPIDCQVGEWSEYSDCNAECNGGVRVRTRNILINPQFGGKECPSLTDSVACNTQSCLNYNTTYLLRAADIGTISGLPVQDYSDKGKWYVLFETSPATFYCTPPISYFGPVDYNIYFRCDKRPYNFEYSNPYLSLYKPQFTYGYESKITRITAPLSQNAVKYGDEFQLTYNNSPYYIQLGFNRTSPLYVLNHKPYNTNITTLKNYCGWNGVDCSPIIIDKWRIKPSSDKPVGKTVQLDDDFQLQIYFTKTGRWHDLLYYYDQMGQIVIDAKPYSGVYFNSTKATYIKLQFQSP